MRKELSYVREQIIQYLTDAEKGNLVAPKINGVSISFANMAKACRIMIEERFDSSFAFIKEHMFDFDDSGIAYMLGYVEKILLEIPGFRLPEKDSLMEKWWKKMEKQEKKEKSDERKK